VKICLRSINHPRTWNRADCLLLANLYSSNSGFKFVKRADCLLYLCCFECVHYQDVAVPEVHLFLVEQLSWYNVIMVFFMYPFPAQSFQRPCCNLMGSNTSVVMNPIYYFRSNTGTVEITFNPHVFKTTFAFLSHQGSSSLCGIHLALWLNDPVQVKLPTIFLSTTHRSLSNVFTGCCWWISYLKIFSMVLSRDVPIPLFADTTDTDTFDHWYRPIPIPIPTR